MANHMKKYALPDEAYDVLKWVGLAFLPAAAVLVATLGDTWGWPNTDEIVVTINAVGVFIAAVIGYSQLTAEDVKPNE